MNNNPPASRQALRKLPFETDRGVASRAALGLIVLASDQTLEYEFRRIAGFPGSEFTNPASTTRRRPPPKPCAPWERTSPGVWG